MWGTGDNGTACFSGLFHHPLCCWLSSSLVPRMTQNHCFSFLAGSSSHSGASRLPLKSSTWMTFWTEDRISVIILPLRPSWSISRHKTDWARSKSLGVWSFIRSSYTFGNSVCPHQRWPQARQGHQSVKLPFWAAHCAVSLSFLLWPTKGFSVFTCPRRNAPALLLANCWC